MQCIRKNLKDSEFLILCTIQTLCNKTLFKFYTDIIGFEICVQITYHLWQQMIKRLALNMKTYPLICVNVLF